MHPMPSPSAPHLNPFRLANENASWESQTQASVTRAIPVAWQQHAWHMTAGVCLERRNAQHKLVAHALALQFSMLAWRRNCVDGHAAAAKKGTRAADWL